MDTLLMIRPAKREDCSALVSLKKELSVHSKMVDKPMLSYQELERDGFDTEPPCYYCIVAETKLPTEHDDIKVVGFALYFFGFAAFEGKVLHLEDFCTTESLRGKGIGSALLKELAKIAVKGNCSRIQLEVLDWNEVALKFYNGHKGVDTTVGEGWHNFRFDKDAIHRLASS